MQVGDPGLRFRGRVADLHTDLELTTSLPMSVVRHRLELLIGSAWQLRDLRKARSIPITRACVRKIRRGFGKWQWKR